MGAVRAVAPVVLVILALAGCGGSSGKKATAVTQGPRTIAGVGVRTIAAGTARFTLSVTGFIGGINVGADENGTLSFAGQRAHIYKLLLSGGIPEEVIIDGPYEYANGDVQAAMNDSTVKAWTKLDTRRLTAKERAASGNELAHVRAPAFLIEGVDHAVLVGEGPGGTAHFRGTVDPARLAAKLPVALRESIVIAVRNDYVNGPFPADFWVDAKGRVRRVHVSYRTHGGGRITVNATYSDFGMPVKIVLPPARGTQVITPNR